MLWARQPASQASRRAAPFARALTNGVEVWTDRVRVTARRTGRGELVVQVGTDVRRWPHRALSWVSGLLALAGLPHLLVLALGDRVGGAALTDARDLGFQGLTVALRLLGPPLLVWLSPWTRPRRRYHAAEHRAMACYDRGAPLTIAQARLGGDLHPRCGGTAVGVAVALCGVMGALLWPLVGPASASGAPALSDHAWQIALQAALLAAVLPLVARGLRHARPDGWLAGLSVPSAWLQRLTTCAPDDAHLEVALAGLAAVLRSSGQRQPAPDKARPALSDRSGGKGGGPQL